MAQPYQAKFVMDPGTIDYTPEDDVLGGTVVVQGDRVAIARVDLPADQPGSLATDGIFDLVKVTGEITAGSAIYWDADGNPLGGTAGTGAATTTSSGNTFLGYSLALAGASDEVVRVEVYSAPDVLNTIHNPTTSVVADPGASGAIPVDNSGHVALVSAGVETRTLAAPTAATGSELLLFMKTDGGNITLTCTTGLNQAGNNTLVFGDAGDTVLLKVIESGSDKRWRIVVADGITPSTV